MKKIFVVLLVVLLSACANTKPNQYYWGNYENLIYKMYNKPGDADPGKQIQLLTEDLQKAQAKGKPVPPGFHAHLGLMYAMLGNAAQSQVAFEQEKTLFPEAEPLVSSLMDKQGKEAEGK